jgi:magnesium transporter
MNVNVPHDADGAFRIFGIVVAMAVLILFSYLSVVRRWWLQAKRRRVPVL